MIEKRDNIYKDKGWKFIRVYEKYHTIQAAQRNPGRMYFLKSLCKHIMVKL